MCNIANEDAAATYSKDSNKRMEFVKYSLSKMSGNLNERNLELFEKFTFALAGTIFMETNPSKDDFLEVANLFFNCLDVEKINDFCEKHQP